MGLADELKKAGVVINPFEQGGIPLKLEWDKSVVGSLFSQETVLILPDMHLADNADGDIFRGTTGSTSRERLVKLLSATAAVKAAGTVHGLKVLQLGDLYDLFRVGADATTVDARRLEIEAAYQDVFDLLTGPLEAQLCYGNHDALLATLPAAKVAELRLAYSHRFARTLDVPEGEVIAFHGHQDQRIDQFIADEDGETVVHFITNLAKRIDNAAAQSFEEGFDIAGEYFSDPELSLAQATQDIWPPAAERTDLLPGWSATRWALRNDRQNLGRLVSQLSGGYKLQMVIVGHSHRPGISFTMVDDPSRPEKQAHGVPLVDVGSWVWGRNQFVIAEGSTQSLTFYTMS